VRRAIESEKHESYILEFRKRNQGVKEETQKKLALVTKN